MNYLGYLLILEVQINEHDDIQQLIRKLCKTAKNQ